VIAVAKESTVDSSSFDPHAALGRDSGRRALRHSALSDERNQIAPHCSLAAKVSHRSIERSIALFRQWHTRVLVNDVIVQVPGPIHMDGKATNQELEPLAW